MDNCGGECFVIRGSEEALVMARVIDELINRGTS